MQSAQFCSLTCSSPTTRLAAWPLSPQILLGFSSLKGCRWPSVSSDRLSLWRALFESRLLFSELSAWQLSSSSRISLVMSGPLGLEGISSLAERHVVILTTCASSRPGDGTRLVANNLQVLPSLGSRGERWGPGCTVRDLSISVHLLL